MKLDKHKEALAEVIDTIQEALDDKKGLLAHQRRLAGMLSLGGQQLVELYFHSQNVIKPGSQIKHEWFGASEKNIRLKLQPLITKPLNALKSTNEIIAYASRIEEDRNELVYGAPLTNDAQLREKIDTFLELKNLIEKLTGETLGPQ